MVIQYTVYILLLLSLFVGCNRTMYQRDRLRPKKVNTITPLITQKPVTVFIHGTWIPIVSYLQNKVRFKPGLVQAQTQQEKFIQGRIGYALHASDPLAFPLDFLYLFNWSGDLSFSERENAAQQLYASLCSCTGPITIIAHSHGCNVALNLAHCAAKAYDTNFAIDTLVLLACPVQFATQDYIYSPIFKKIYSLFSTTDMAQILDPQGLYSRFTSTKDQLRPHPLFSERLFPPASHLVQARVLIDMANPGHNDFTMHYFLNRLATILRVLDKATKKLPKKQQEYCIINVPKSKGLPQVLLQQQNRRMVPISL